MGTRVNVEVFARALDRAIQEGCKVRPSGQVFLVRSGSDANRWYRTTYRSCTCPAGQHGTLCKHRALVAYVTGYVDKLCDFRYPAVSLTTISDVLDEVA